MFRSNRDRGCNDEPELSYRHLVVQRIL